GSRGPKLGRRMKRKKSRISALRTPRSARARLIVASVQLAYGLLELAVKQGRDDRPRTVQGCFDVFQFVAARWVKHEIDDGLRKPQHARVTDAQAQTPEVGPAQGRLDVLQPVVASMAAALLELGVAGRQVEFV